MAGWVQGGALRIPAGQRGIEADRQSRPEREWSGHVMESFSKFRELVLIKFIRKDF